MGVEHISYSDKYYDEVYEYRHVILPKDISEKYYDLSGHDAKSARLLGEDEWRSIGVQQSIGWVHYMIHAPEPHIMLFRRPHGKRYEDGQEY